MSNSELAKGRTAESEVREHVLLLRAHSWICALPIKDTLETMRALPIRPIEGAPPFLRGLAIIRGVPLPVLRLAALLGDSGSEPGRKFVTLRVSERKLALEVDEVIGTKHIDTTTLEATPPLLSVALSEPIAKLGTLDGKVLALLSATRLISEDLWSVLGQRGAQ